ncbi:MAG: HAD family phosphatase [Alphaproteobacteria bacterium]|nr:HAD family phosphatase [Alphaproteobacteria bacterium]
MPRMTADLHPKAVIFDCDGVLLDSEYQVYDALMHVLTPMGVHVEAEIANQFHGTAPPLIESVCNLIGVPVTPTMMQAYRERRRWQLENHLETIPHAQTLVESLAVPKAVASGSPMERLQLTLKPTGFWNHFTPHIYSGFDQPNGKPAPDVYLHAARQIGTLPEHCLVIEDSANGVKAGVAADMTVWGFVGGKHCDDTHGDMLRDAGAVAVFETMPDIHAAIRTRLPHLLKEGA